ncbi:MAG TPA: hypothetical protein PKZ08_02605 [Vicinamibacterales bacterium]|nr:hypothetical protein [Vicinamibacterales bacterium]
MDCAAMTAANLDLFGEEIVYDLGNGATRAVRAVVDRNPPMPTGEAPQIHRQRFRVLVRNSATDGIAATEFDAGAHKLRIARRIGGTPEPWGGWIVAGQTESALILEK